MARFLFAVPPLTGHVNPTVAVAAALVERGHEVAWVGHGSRIRELLPVDARLFSLDQDGSEELIAPMAVRPTNLRGFAAFKFLWSDFLLPLARASLPALERAVVEFGADVVIGDQQALAGPLAARRHGRPWATFSTTSVGVIETIERFPAVARWWTESLQQLEREAGLPVTPRPDLSERLVVIFSTPELVGEGTWPEHYAFVGPALTRRPAAVAFPWERLGSRPVLLVSLGTINAEVGRRFYQSVIAAFSDAPLQIVVVAPPELVGEVPDHVVVQARVPQLELMERVAAVVTHGGHNTVCEALAHGVPLVVAPIRDDQPFVAQQVVDAGAGVRLKFSRASAAVLREAVDGVLGEPRYREGARRIQDSFARAGGARGAAARLEALA